jgi:ferredoxin-NADP reductase
MPELKVGSVTAWHKLSPVLATFRLLPEDDDRFPDYVPGQYMALQRDNCWLTRRVVSPDGNIDYLPDLDETGGPRLGTVTHSYSIASAPFETSESRHLEFYVVLEKDPHGIPGRLSGSLFKLNPPFDDQVRYFHRIAGTFTLDKRAKGFRSVLLIGTGTGLAPFVSMIKQLHFEAGQGKTDGVQYTLLHANRTFEELGYHRELVAMAASGRFDFSYLASVSRPTARDVLDPHLARGRANNVLRRILDLPTREEQDLQEASTGRGDLSRARAAVENAVAPALPRYVSREELRARIDPARTVILNCGNPYLMTDIKSIAEARHIHFEKEDW